MKMYRGVEVSGQLYAPATLPPLKRPPGPTGWEAECAAEPVLALRSKQKPLALAGIKPRPSGLLARRYTDSAIPGPRKL
jgi:hypothetical protein